VSRLLSCIVLGGVASGCGEPDKERPCVPGVEAGDVLGARVLEVYDSSSTFEYDLAEFFGPDSGMESYLADCNAERDLVLGETLVVDVVERYDSWSGGPCSTVGLSVRDTEKVVMGPAGMIDFRPGGNVLLGVAMHCCTSVDGCSRSWGGSFLVHHGAGPFDQPVPGEVPPVLLRRGMAPTDSTCTTYVEPRNECLFVLELEKL